MLNGNGFYDNLLSFLDQVVEQEFLTSSARQIIISVATAKQLIDQLQSFIPVIDPSINITSQNSLFNLLLLLLLLLLFIIYIVNLLVVRPRSCQVIYYFDTPVLGRRHQSFGHVNNTNLCLC